MKIKMNTRVSGPTLNAEPGDIVEVSEATAKDLLAGNYASEATAADLSPEPAEEPTEPEPVEKPAPKKAPAKKATAKKGPPPAK